MPDYPITYVVSFAVNGVMVIVVLLCLIWPQVGSHNVKIHISIFLSGLLTLFIPTAAENSDS